MYLITPDSLPISKISATLEIYRAEKAKNQAQLNGRRAAVLVPLLVLDNQWHLLFTRRSETVNDHKGQVSFPGGAIEPYDLNPELAAVREAQEEIGIWPNEVEIMGRMQNFLTVSKFIITPVVAKVNWPIPLTINQEEVSHVFTIPLSWLRISSNFELRTWQMPSGSYEKVVFFKEYQGECLWGISARITLDFLELLGLLEDGKTH